MWDKRMWDEKGSFLVVFIRKEDGRPFIDSETRHFEYSSEASRYAEEKNKEEDFDYGMFKVRELSQGR